MAACRYRTGYLGSPDSSARSLWFVPDPGFSPPYPRRQTQLIFPAMDAGASSTVPRDEPTAFVYQLEGMLHSGRSEIRRTMHREWSGPRGGTAEESHSGFPHSSEEHADQEPTEVDRAIDNLVKSGKMFGVPGVRRELLSTFRATRRDPRNAGFPRGTSLGAARIGSPTYRNT